MKRLHRFSVLALALAALACGAEANPPHTPTDGGTPPGTTCKSPSARHTNVAPSAGRPTDAARLIVFGDSIGAGVGAPQGQAYFDLLQDPVAGAAEPTINLATLYGHDVELVNVAAGGATTANLAEQVQELKRQLPAPVSGHSVIAVTIGGNDVVRAFLSDPAGAPLDNAEQAIRTLAAAITDPAWFPDGVTLLFSNVYDPSDGVGRAQECLNGYDFSRQTSALPLWSERYATIARELGFGVVDALGHFRGHGFHSGDSANPNYQSADPTLWFDADCIHPNARGHQELRRLFYEALDCQYVATP